MILKPKLTNFVYAAIFSSLIFIGVFQINEKISLPILAFSFGFFFFAKKISFYYEDFLLLAFTSLMTLFSAFNINSSGMLYIFSFTAVIIIFSKVSSAIPSNFNLNKLLFWLILVVNFYIIYEFLTKNFAPFLYVELPRSRVENMDALFMGMFSRARGFAEEPGHMGLFYEFALPIVFIEMIPRLKRVEKIVFYFSTILALFFIFSAFTTTVLAIYFFLYVIIRLNTKQRILLIIAASISFFLILKIIPSSRLFLQLAYESISAKVTYSSNSLSASDRLSRLADAISIYSQHPLGIGAMNMKSFSIYPSSLNLYLDLLLFFGPLTLAIFMVYLIIAIIRAYAINKWSYFASIILISCHYMIISNFWYPFLWILIGIIQYKYKEIKGSAPELFAEKSVK